MKYSKNFYQIKSNQEIYERLVKEREYIGYYSLPYTDTKSIREYAKSVTKNHIVVVGIGGSSLGTYAIHNFLKCKDERKNLHFLESTDPLELQRRLKNIDLGDALFVIVSKSGSTIETVSILKYLHVKVVLSKSNTICITETGSLLYDFAMANGMKTFEVPKNVGGRFSVFSNVGLVPLVLVGVDIDELLIGCKIANDSFFNQKEYYGAIMEKARFIVENKHKFNINVIFSYSSLLEGFNKWYVQLWGESLGKININGTRQALTPVGLVGPVDQHSFLQLITEGKRDKTVTFVKLSDFNDELEIPKDESLVGFEYLDKLKFSSLINTQADSTIEAIDKLGDIPYDVVTIETQDERSIAKLMYSYMLLTSAVGSFLQINTYDQPGVEAGKIILSKKLLS